MEELVRYDKYEGFLPKPCAFPSNFKKYRIKDYPYSVCDFYILDLYADTCFDLPYIECSASIKELLAGIDYGKPLTNPKYVGKNLNYEFFICFDSDKNPIVMQIVFYQYFLYRYKGCSFLSMDGHAIGVSDKCGSAVGIIMPLYLPNIKLIAPFYEED